MTDLWTFLQNFNDKMTMMGDSVHRYQVGGVDIYTTHIYNYLRPQAMIDKQSEQLSDVTREKERYKRDLEHVKVILTIKMVVIWWRCI